VGLALHTFKIAYAKLALVPEPVTYYSSNQKSFRTLLKVQSAVQS